MTYIKKPDMAVSLTLTPQMQLGLFVLWMEKNPKEDVDHMTQANFRGIVAAMASALVEQKLNSLSEEQTVKKFDYASRLRGILTLT